MHDLPPLISIVIPCLNEEQGLPALFEELEASFAARPEYRYEVIVVDDGSQDGTLQWLRERVEQVDYLRVLSLSRNFGSHAALLAGLRAINGDAATILAADLQDPPDLVARLADRWQQGERIVWAIRSSRADSLPTRMASWLAYRIFSWLSGMNIPRAGLDVFLADRQVVESVVGTSWRNSSILLAFYWAGFPSGTLNYDKRERRCGTSRWSFRQRARLFIDMTVGFSSRPMRLISLGGLLSALAGFSYAAVILGRWLAGAKTTVEGWSSLMVLLLVIGGLILVSLGIVGEYLWRTLEESRQRPMYLVTERLPRAAFSKATDELARE